MAFIQKLSTQDIDTIIILLKEDKTYQEIGNIYNVSRECIRQVAKKHNLQGQGAKKRRDTRSNQLTNKLKEIYGQFYEDGVVNKNDFYEICKFKFRTKKNQVKTWDWTIKFSDIVWNTTCPILGIPLNYYAEGRQEDSPSFDRINSNVGYVQGNVQIISWRANRIKNNGTSKEHFLIAEHLKKLGQ